ncbi:MAG: transcription antitermination factor NusB [Flavobacteriaceae bacterium]|nr:transcription antitermination factor NusB [Flavobacteriaceae bacterium]
MLNRRHIRVKVMHSLYAYLQSKNDNIPTQEKFLMNSIERIYDLFVLQLQILVELQERALKHINLVKNKHLATEEDKNPNERFVNNSALLSIVESASLKANIEALKLDNWKEDNEYINILFQEMVEREFYSEYMSKKTGSFDEDKRFIEQLFKEVIAPNEKLYSYYEDKKLTWINDYPAINTSILKLIKSIKPNQDQLVLPIMYRDEEEDPQFALDLFRRTLKYNDELQEEINGKSSNWESDRITLVDAILLKMAICELLHFPSIPVKVTINEYLEIAKEYATPKSSGFINGILDNLIKEYKSQNKLNKSGRGLM